MSLISKYVKRFECRDLTLKYIKLTYKQLTDSELSELANCLLAYPNVIENVYLGTPVVSNKIKAQLARYMAISSTIEVFSLQHQFIPVTFFAVELAAALHTNSSLKTLLLFENQTADRTCIDIAFTVALRLNPVRPADSNWVLYSWPSVFKKLKDAAEKSTPPSMLEFLLCAHLDTEKIETKIH